MPQIAAGSSVTLTLTDSDSMTIQTRGVATLTAVSGLGVPAGKIGEYSGAQTFGPYAAGQVTIAAGVAECYYEVADASYKGSASARLAADAAGNVTGLVRPD